MRKTTICFVLLLTTLIAYSHGGGNYEHSDFFRSIKKGDKAAIVMVHFGSTHADTRELTIDVLNGKVKQTFPELEVREAYTSRIVIKRLGDRGIKKQNPAEALKQLHTEGYTHVLIQASTIIDGIEMESLNRDAAEAANLFKDVRVSEPLLYSPQDYEKVIEALTPGNDNNMAYIWVGHGTYDSSTAQYAMLDYMLKAKGHANCFVGTIEGYPDFEDMLNQLKASGLKKARLLPFLFVAGEHAKNDIAGEWKEALKKEGFVVDVEMKGLGENPQIQDIYISHLRFMVNHKKTDIMEKKALYEKTGEKSIMPHRRQEDSSNFSRKGVNRQCPKEKL